MPCWNGSGATGANTGDHESELRHAYTVGGNAIYSNARFRRGLRSSRTERCAGRGSTMLTSMALQTAEAALTGENLPVSKDISAIAEEVGLGDRHNIIFSGTAVTYGRGKAAIVATGMQTQMGRIAGMLKEARRRSRRCKGSSLASVSCWGS